MPRSLTDIFDQYRVAYKRPGEHHHSTRGWVSVDCPQCSPGSGRYRLGFELNGRRANCWVCGRMNAMDILALVCRVSAKDAWKLWRERGFQSYFEEEVKGPSKLVEPSHVGPLLPQHRRYLMQRGFDPDALAQLWGIRGIELATKLSWRIYIPIYDKMGRQVSWTTRSINPNAEQRYISASAEQELVPHKTVLYGAHLARSVAVVVEGPTDAWAIGPGAVATCGVGCTSAQIAAAAEYPVRLVCFDNEDDAQRRADEVCEELSIFPGVTKNIVFDSGDDPASADPQEVAEFRAAFLE